MDVNKIIAQNVKKLREKRKLTLDAASEIMMQHQKLPAYRAVCLRRLKRVM